MQFNSEFNGLRGNDDKIDFRRYSDKTGFFNSKIFSSRGRRSQRENKEYFSEFNSNLKIKNISEIYNENLQSSIKLSEYQRDFDILRNNINRLNNLVERDGSDNDLSTYLMRNENLRNTKIPLKKENDEVNVNESKSDFKFKSKFLTQRSNSQLTLTKSPSNSTKCSVMSNSIQTAGSKFNVSIEKVNTIELKGRREKVLELEEEEILIDDLVDDILNFKREISNEDYCTNHSIKKKHSSSKKKRKREIFILTDKNSKTQSKLQNGNLNFSPSTILSKYNYFSTNKKDKTYIKLLKELKEINSLAVLDTPATEEFNFSDFSFSRDNNFFTNKQESSSKKLSIPSNKKYKEEDYPILDSENYRRSVENQIKKSLNFSEDNDNMTEDPSPFNAGLSSINKQHILECMELNGEYEDVSSCNNEFNLNSSKNISNSTFRKRVSFHEESPVVFNYDNKKALKNFYINAKGLLNGRRKKVPKKSILKDKNSFNSGISEKSYTSDFSIKDEKSIALDNLNKLIQECEVNVTDSRKKKNTSIKKSVSPVNKRNLTPEITSYRSNPNSKIEFKGCQKYCRKFENNPYKFFTIPPTEDYLRSLSLEVIKSRK